MISPFSKMSSHLTVSSPGLEPHQQQNLANGLTIRRVSRAANGEVVYPCDFCDRYFTNRHHLSSHMVRTASRFVNLYESKYGQ